MNAVKKFQLFMQHNSAFQPLVALDKKKKDCCKSYKKGDRCKKCPGKK
jgi:hypothetical protein